MLTLNDGRTELWQWDTGRTLSVDDDCSQVHFSNKVFGRSIDVDVVDGAAIIPDILLQTDKDLNVWAFAGTAENGYTKISKTFKVNRRNKPADYVFTPADQMTLQTIQSQIGDLSDLTTEAKDTLVAAINEAARTGGGAGSMDLRVADGYVQYSTDSGRTWKNLIAVSELKGDTGADGSPVNWRGAWEEYTEYSKLDAVSYDGSSYIFKPDTHVIGSIPGVDEEWGLMAQKGNDGANGVTPHIGDNGHWYLGATDTGKPSRGETGPQGTPGIYYGTTQPTGDTHPVWIDPDGGPDDGGLLPAVTAADNGKVLRVDNGAWAAADMPEVLPNPNALTFTGAVTGSYDGSAPLSVEIPSGGGSGSDISLGLTGAAVGQIAKITAVDGTGKPTAWEAVDMPTGADGTSSSFRVLNASIDIGGTARADISTADSGQSYADLDIQEFVMEAVIRGNPDLTNSQRVVFSALSGSISKEVGLKDSAILTKNNDFRCFMVHARKIMGQTWQIRIAGSSDASIYFKDKILTDSMFSSDLTGMRIIGGYGASAFGEGSTVRVWGK